MFGVFGDPKRRLRKNSAPRFVTTLVIYDTWERVRPFSLFILRAIKLLIRSVYFVITDLMNRESGPLAHLERERVRTGGVSSVCLTWPPDQSLVKNEFIALGQISDLVWYFVKNDAVLTFSSGRCNSFIFKHAKYFFAGFPSRPMATVRIFNAEE